MPTCLGGGSAVGEEPEGSSWLRGNGDSLVMLKSHRRGLVSSVNTQQYIYLVFCFLLRLPEATERGLSQLAAAIADAVSRTEENAKQALFSEVSLVVETPGVLFYSSTTWWQGHANSSATFSFLSRQEVARC